MEDLKPTEKTDVEKLIEEQRLTRMQIARMILEQQQTRKETRIWGIVIAVLLSIPLLVSLISYLKVIIVI